jgi:methenyltetrahydromethanopterin cyclohydrolase
MNNDLWDIFKKCNDAKTLLRAAEWSRYTIENIFEPDYITAKDTYANLLYKAGKVNEALAFQKQFVEQLSR